MHDVACEFACAVAMRSSNGRERPWYTQDTIAPISLLPGVDLTVDLHPVLFFLLLQGAQECYYVLSFTTIHDRIFICTLLYVYTGLMQKNRTTWQNIRKLWTPQQPQHQNQTWPYTWEFMVVLL